MKQGEIYWVELGEARGHQQAGRRPAILMQSEVATQTLPTVLMIPLTTRLDTLRFPGTVLIEPDVQNGLKRLSVALVFQMTAVDTRFVRERIGQLSADKLEEVLQALNDLLTESRNDQGANAG